MEEQEIIPVKFLRKFDDICLHDDSLRQNKLLQKKLIEWAQNLITESRNEWSELHNDTLESVVKCYTSSEAKRKSAIKDKKYAPFREYFKQVQREKYEVSLQNGSRLTANSFVEWFLKNKPEQVEIPYIKQNQKNKLRQLAQENNREFKKLLPDKA